jgi:hypothetical protein
MFSPELVKEPYSLKVISTIQSVSGAIAIFPWRILPKPVKRWA